MAQEKTPLTEHWTDLFEGCVCFFFLIACLAYMPACALTQFDLQCQRERNIFSPSTGSLDS